MLCETVTGRTNVAVARRLRALLEESREPAATSFELQADTQLSALGLDSIALVSFFLRLEAELHIPASVLPLLLRRTCTFGELVSTVTASSVRSAVVDQAAKKSASAARIQPTV